MQRIEHWVLVASFMGLLITGLPQKFPDNDISTWLINTVGGIDQARLIHRISAAVFIAESVFYCAEIALSLARRRFRPSMFVTLQDFRDAFNMLRYSIGLTPERPRFDRFDYRQKFEYWGIVFGAVIMIATGFTLWFPTYVTKLAPGEFVAAAKEMHGGEALLALLVIIIWHLYDISLSPAVFPLDTAMITGRISRHRLMEEHGREYERVMGAQAVPMPVTTALPLDEPQPAAQAEIGRRLLPRISMRWSGVLRRSLQVRIMLLVAIGLAVLLAAFSIASFLAVDASTNRSLDERRALAQATASHADYTLREGMRVLEEATFTEGFDVTDGNPEPEREALRSVAASRMFNLVYLTDARGAVSWTEPLYPWAVRMGLDSEPYVETALKTGKPAVSGRAKALSGEEPVVVVVVPLHDKAGAIAGLVAGEIALNGPTLTDVIRPASIDGSAYAQVVDNQGEVLASTRSGQLLTRSDHEGQLAGLIARRQSVSGTCHDCHQSSGQEVRQTEVMAFAPLESAPWGVIIRQPESEALAPARRLKEQAILLGVPAVLLALLFAWVSVRSVVRPVRALTASAESIAAGNLNEPVPALGRDEIGTLARAFETMRRRLKGSLDRIQAWGTELEERVQERTRELEASRDHLRAVADENAALFAQLKRKEEARTHLLQKVITAQEEERRRIARELHDETSQAITALVLGIENETSRPGGPSDERLTQLRTLAEGTLEGVHRLVYDLRPSVLDDLGLVAGLRWYLETRLQPIGVDVEITVEGEAKRLPGEVETALFRIGQEAISNVARHSGASRASLRLRFQERAISMELEDNGSGFDAAAVSAAAGDTSGFGIMGIQERAALLGGTLSIDSQPGAGTRVRVSVPLPEGAP